MMGHKALFVLLLATFALVNLVNAADRKTMPANIPATRGFIHTNFLISAKGTTKNELFSFNVKNNIGTFTVRGEEYAAVAYYTQGTIPVGTDQARWVDFLGVSKKEDNLAWIVFQCEPIINATTIEAVYEEDYFHEGVADPINVDCNFVDLAGKPDAFIHVELPALKKVPLAGAVDSNVTILGDNVYLDHAHHGWVVIDGQRYITVPINNIPCPDCGGDCETCYRSPWYEAHVMFYNVELTEIGFGIFYMYPYNRTFVQFNYTLMLPTLKTPAITFRAHWYGDPLSNEECASKQQMSLMPQQPQMKTKYSGRPPVGKSVFNYYNLAKHQNRDNTFFEMEDEGGGTGAIIH